MNMHAIREFSPGLPIKIESREDGKAGSKKDPSDFSAKNRDITNLPGPKK